MPRKRVKRGPDRVRSVACTDKRPRGSEMSMERMATRNAYSSREVVTDVPTPKGIRKENRKALESFQSTLKPIRSSKK